MRRSTIFGRLNNLKIKTASAAISGLLMLLAAAFAGISYATLAEIDRVGETWQALDAQAAAKGDILSSLRGALGYGGVIHQFKNFVLRMDRSRIAEVNKKLSDASDTLTAYSTLGLNDREKAAGGKVLIKAWHNPQSSYVLQVVDTGIGMALDDIPKALARFGQVDSELARKYEGTGLGLPLTKALVELHGGYLDLQSEIGVGTTVTVRFPAERVIGATATKKQIPAA